MPLSHADSNRQWWVYRYWSQSLEAFRPPRRSTRSRLPYSSLLPNLVSTRRHCHSYNFKASKRASTPRHGRRFPHFPGGQLAILPSQLSPGLTATTVSGFRPDRRTTSVGPHTTWTTTLRITAQIRVHRTAWQLRPHTGECGLRLSRRLETSSCPNNKLLVKPANSRELPREGLHLAEGILDPGAVPGGRKGQYPPTQALKAYPQ